MGYPTNTPEKFWARVVPGPNGCRLWTGPVNKISGYGYLHYEGKKEMAHRIGFKLLHGYMPELPNLVMHLCDVKLCALHLYEGTQRENILDAISKGRMKAPEAARGEAHVLSKLTAEKVIEIRQRYANGESQTDLAGVFGIDQTAVSSVIRRRTWKHVL